MGHERDGPRDAALDERLEVVPALRLNALCGAAALFIEGEFLPHLPRQAEFATRQIGQRESLLEITTTGAKEEVAELSAAIDHAL
jgi:hypothetical protein